MSMCERKTISFDQGWDSMEKGIAKLIRILESLPEPQFSSEEYMMLYTTIYNMCTQKPPHEYSQQLHHKYSEVFQVYITSTVLPSLREKHDEFLLRELVKRWVNLKVLIRWLSHFFHYLDCHVARRSLPTMHEVGPTCFREVYKDGKVKDAVISLIDQEREGEQIDRAFLKNILDIFVESGMDCYENDFEAAMLIDTTAYYSRKASKWIIEDSCPDYMLKVEDCLRKEKDRVSHYLHISSEQKLLEKVQHELLFVHANQLLEKEHSGCHALLRDDKVDDLSRMFRLFSRIPHGLELVSGIFEQQLTSEGTSLVKQAEDAASNKKVFVEKIIELLDKYMAYVKNCFESHLCFRLALQGFMDFFNQGIAGSSIAEYLATFCDNILKKGGSVKLRDEAIEGTLEKGGTEKLSHEEIEEALEKVVNLLAYISDRHLFAEFYRRKLAHRLLFNKIVNDDHERSILTKLSQKFGEHFTSKMQRMFTDWTGAPQIQTRFEEYLNSSLQPSPGIEFTVTVLATVFWSSYESCDLNLPAEMVECVEVFDEFYQKVFKRRKLKWIYSLGTCNINGKFDQKTIELIVTTYQASVLLLFNSSDRLSYSEIKIQLNLPHPDIVKLLHSLSCAKYKILLKEPNTKTISQTDTFEFNSKFTHKMTRIEIPLRAVNDDRVIVIGDVNMSRIYAIDASIVRIMKYHTVMSRDQLVIECDKQLSNMFKLDLRTIKKRLEDLIIRGYLERDEDNKNLFRTFEGNR